MSRSLPKPLVGIPANVIDLPERTVPQHGAGESYIGAVAKGAEAMPVVIPALGGDFDAGAVAQRIDGLFLTGGRANIEPHHYGGAAFPDDEIRDPARDATVLPLIRACIDAGVPLFGVCRGIQEINVALGGSLHYRVHLVDRKMDHRMPVEGDLETKFALRHTVSLAPGGTLEALLGRGEIMVNTAHGQGIDRLADGLTVEAMAPDGLVEAVRVTNADSFAIGVQWHAEWRWQEHDLAAALFAAFGRAASDRAVRCQRSEVL